MSKFEIELNASPNEIVNYLREHVDSRKWVWFADKQFWGDVSNEGFCLNRTIHYSNGFQPTLFGNIESKGRTTTVSVRAGFQLYRLVFMLLPIAMCVLVVLGSVLSNGLIGSLGETWGLVAISLLWLMPWIVSYCIDVPQSKQLLFDTLAKFRSPTSPSIE